jgi:hypothetical protein
MAGTGERSAWSVGSRMSAALIPFLKLAIGSVCA